MEMHMGRFNKLVLKYFGWCLRFDFIHEDMVI